MKIEWEPRETVATAFLSQTVAEYGGQSHRYYRLGCHPVITGLLNIFYTIPGAAPLCGLPRAMCCRPVYTGLLNSAHLRFAVQLDKLFFGKFFEMPNL